MSNKIHEWSDERPYYMIYQDKNALKNIYAQLNMDLPDVGAIAYIGANTYRQSKDYSFNGEHGNCKEKKNENKVCVNKRSESREKAGLVICDVNETSEIREYANIQEIKEMNNMLFYRQILKSIIRYCEGKDKYPICYIRDKVELYSSYKDDKNEDVFVQMNTNCVWLKRSNLDTTVENLANMMGNVCLVGYIVEEATENKPRVVKGLVIFT